ncbi:3'(2'),5'-bisphosphate nucleotidase 1 [Pseudolycoriella hygida]|uniref:3'(2'),5'-bisphosphate nucleotidase 1 n=1 Tax=Pseudolycoriella hygida TaxID=35572 RepID=A0A9Q0MLC0_9DIPT|nr:3'(2'),5'-bisphosphate nucleotidase 1 [Pseudolycoriella hygida]
MAHTQCPIVMRILAAGIQVANRAGSIIRDVMSKGELGIVEKSKNDLQTEADRSSQQCIIASLTKQFPNIKIIGEEGQSDLCNIPSEWLVMEQDAEFLKNSCPNKYLTLTEEQFDSVVVWVDPLDGTTEYTQGFLEHVTVLIGISVNEEAVGGIIHQPYYKNGEDIGRTIWGLKGLGVGGFQPIDIRNDGQFVVTTTRSHFNESVKNAVDALKPTEILRVGGAGYKVLQLLEGKAHAYIFASPGCKKWDTCAPEAILEAHGGVLTDVMGNHYSYGEKAIHLNKLGVIATAKTVDHQNVINLIPANLKEAMTGK